MGFIMWRRDANAFALRARTRQIMDKMWKIFKNLVMLLVNYNIICIIFRFDHWYNLYLPVVRVGSELWYERLFLVCSSSCSVARALRILILTFSINPFPSPLYHVHTNTVFKLRDTPQSFATQKLRWALPSYCLGIVKLISYRIFTPRCLTRTVINRMRWVTCENSTGINQGWSIDPPKSKVQKSNSSVDVPPTVVTSTVYVQKVYEFVYYVQVQFLKLICVSILEGGYMILHEPASSFSAKMVYLAKLRYN